MFSRDRKLYNVYLASMTVAEILPVVSNRDTALSTS